MHVSPPKHSYAWLPRKCEYQTDTQTDRQMLDKVIPMCRLASQATQKHSSVEGIREFHLTVDDLQSNMILASSWMLQIMETRIFYGISLSLPQCSFNFPLPLFSINYIILCCFPCSKHTMTMLPTVTSCQYQCCEVIAVLPHPTPLETDLSFAIYFRENYCPQWEKKKVPLIPPVFQYY